MEDLKDLVIQTLDTNGILDKFRAQLRSNVFSAIESTENKAPLAVESSSADTIMSTEEGQIAIEVIRDFLEFYNLDYTMNVFLPECRLPSESRDKSYLSEKLGLNNDSRKPFLSNLIASKRSGGGKENVPAKPAPTKEFVPDPKPIEKPAPAAKIEQSKVITTTTPPPPKQQVTPPKEIKPLPKKQDNISLAPLNPIGGKAKLPGLGQIGKNLDESNESEKRRLEEVENKLKRMEQKEKDVNTLSIKSPQSDDDSEISEEIDEELEVENTDRAGSADPFFGDSMGASSMGVDASVNSVTLEGYDHVESVSRAK